MRLEALEKTDSWQATAVYDGSQGRLTLCLLHDELTTGGFYWVVADYRGQWPWDAVRNFNPAATAHMVARGKLRLVKGHWPELVAKDAAVSSEWAVVRC